ncbi:hypothetical protein FRC09_019026 [Ceratobasidium sp. 395]|nr:hypothetical protein FRC09_019026 [Ceratobasidium sp. 395]
MGSQDSLKNMQDASLNRITDISTGIREAIRRSLPTPPEQLFTVMIPGKVVNFDDYKVHVDPTDILLPTKVQLNQAILCDDMPPLSNLQLGPTGRSVARTYTNAISKLVSSGSTVGINEGETKSKDQQRYEQGMAILSSQVAGKNKSIVELYTEKQKAYTEAVKAKTHAFHQALERAQNNSQNITPKKIREEYDSWVQENGRMHRNYVQAAYMDWVITGKKEEAEYWFAVVDQDTVMARVEQSKEAMRLAVVQDEDGTTEYQTVKLEPSDWANKCLEKMSSGTNQTKSAEWYTWEINRLEKINAMLGTMSNSAKPDAQAATATQALQTAKDDAKKGLEGAMTDYLSKKKAYQESAKKTTSAQKPANSSNPSNQTAPSGATGGGTTGGSTTGGSTTGGSTTGGSTTGGSTTAGSTTAGSTTSESTDTLRDKYNEAQMKLSNAQVEYDKISLASLIDENKNVRQGLSISVTEGAQTQIDLNKKLIEDYQSQRKKLVKDAAPTKEVAYNTMAEELGISKAQADPSQKRSESGAKPIEDFFTPITVEVSASSDTKKTQSSASELHAAAAASGLVWHASMSLDMSKAHDDAQSELVKSQIKISFECMRVDIRRPWMRPELFQDPDLIPGHGIRISPGIDQLNKLLKSQSPDTAQQGIFPMYPVAFIVACNVVLEISGSTSSLQTYMNTSSVAADVNVGYGPFTANVHGGTTSTSTSATCTATDTGCRIEIKSPQIIGWVSQMVPKLEGSASQPDPPTK